MMRWLSVALAATLGIMLGPVNAFGQDYPSRPVRLIAPIAAGGLTDTLARTLAARLAERLGQPVVVENRPGGGGVIGMQAAAKSPADGHTLVLVYQGVASVNPSLYRNLPYDTLRDFVAVAPVASFPLLLVVNPDLKARSAREFVELARAGAASGAAMAIASAGNASTSHLALELFKRAAGTSFTHVAYKGEAPALTEVVGGTVPAAFATPTAAMALIQAGKLRAIAISTHERSRALPDLPTISESGVPGTAGFEMIGWYGVMAPAGTSPAIVTRLNRDITAILAEPEIRARLQGQGVEARAGSPEDFQKQIRDETERWRKLIAEAGIRVD